MSRPRARTAGGIAGAILAGGKALRYGGVPKGLLEVGGGETILDREIAALQAGGVADVRIVAREPEPYARFGLRVAPDIRPGMGPLGGIEAALADIAGRSEAVFLLPCDLPGITAREVSAMMRAFLDASELVAVAVTAGGVWQPLCSVVHNAARSAVGEALDAGRLRVRDVWEALGALPVHFEDPAPFFNVNSPGDLACWQGKAKQTPSRAGTQERTREPRVRDWAGNGC